MVSASIILFESNKLLVFKLDSSSYKEKMESLSLKPSSAEYIGSIRLGIPIAAFFLRVWSAYTWSNGTPLSKASMTKLVREIAS